MSSGGKAEAAAVAGAAAAPKYNPKPQQSQVSRPEDSHCALQLAPASSRQNAPLPAFSCSSFITFFFFVAFALYA